MLRSAQGGGRPALMLAVLVIGLLAGLVAMHHLSAGAAGPHRTAVSGSGAESVHAPAPDVDAGMQRDETPAVPVPSDHSATGLLHLCLAILTGVAVIIAVLLEWRRSVLPTARPPLWASRPVPIPRGPPPSAPARLALLCVLRT